MSCAVSQVLARSLVVIVIVVHVLPSTTIATIEHSLLSRPSCAHQHRHHHSRQIPQINMTNSDSNSDSEDSIVPSSQVVPETQVQMATEEKVGVEASAQENEEDIQKTK